MIYTYTNIGIPSWYSLSVFSRMLNPLHRRGQLKRTPAASSTGEAPAASSTEQAAAPAKPPTTASLSDATCPMDINMRAILTSVLHAIGQHERDMALAIRNSLINDALSTRQRRTRMELVQSRLKLLGRQRQPTPALGDCQFIAVARSLGLPDDCHGELREGVCDYLTRHGQDFESFQTDGSLGARGRPRGLGSGGRPHRLGPPLPPP